ncbi:multidrug resistance-associated protein 5 [Tanacetum coccineum]
MAYEPFAEFFEEKCENYFQGLYNQVPNVELEKELVRVSNDRELSYMFDIEETFGRLELYLNRLHMDLSKYLSQANTIEMDARVSKTICLSKKKSSTTNKGKEKVSQDEIEGVEARTSTVDSDYDSEFDNDDDNEYDSDNLIDYLSLGEEELIELRNMMKANREAKAKGNFVPEMNKPNAKNSMPANTVRSETFEEHDIYMNELLTRLNTTYENGKTQDPFISVEKHVGEKYVTIQQFKERLTYYALANGFSLWYEKSCGKKVVAKCGQRPPRLYVPDKVKQRKHTRYPSVSSDDALGDVMLVGEHYAMLRSYGKTILDSNPGSTVKLGVTVNPDDKTYFDRFYLCFARLVAWAVVNVENKENWSWFLELLEDLSCNRGNGLTHMSDKHKGLIEVVKDVMPNAEPTQCARHIYENFRKHFPSANPNAHKYLMDKYLQTWSRAFFEVDRACEAVENGFSE